MSGGVRSKTFGPQSSQRSTKLYRFLYKFQRTFSCDFKVRFVNISCSGKLSCTLPSQSTRKVYFIQRKFPG